VNRVSVLEHARVARAFVLDVHQAGDEGSPSEGSHYQLG
jgi:hypothetical protein